MYSKIMPLNGKLDDPRLKVGLIFRSGLICPIQECRGRLQFLPYLQMSRIIPGQ